MALTISIEGTGIIANSDGLTDSAGGSWSELGAGSISLSTETYKYGSSCVAGAYSNKAGWHYYDRGSGNSLNFGSGGSQEGELVYLWVFNPTPGLNETTANSGLRLRFGTDTTNYREWMILSSNNLNGWDGRWKVFVIDPTKTGSWSDTGTYNTSSIRYFGIYMDAVALAKGDNIFISQIIVGKGIRVTGTSTTGWDDIVTYCTDYPNRAYGMIEKRGSTIYVKGKVFIGSSSQTAVTTFSDSGKNIQFEKSEYWSGSAWVSTMPTTACGIILEDATSYATTYQDGVIVGTDNGRSGSSFTGNSNENAYFDIFNTTKNNAASAALFYGTKFQSLYGTINAANDSDFKFLGCSFVDSSQFNPVGAPVIRNCIFAETSDVDAALLWNENIDIQDCNFIANTTGAAIEMPSSVGTPYSFTQLYFSGNTYDVLNSSGSAITINKAGTPASDPSTSEGSSVTYQGSVSVSVTVKDIYGTVIQNAQTGIFKTSDGTQILNTDTNASGVASTTYSGATPAEVKVWIRKASSGDTKYKNYSSIQNITSSGLTLNVALTVDPNNNATT